MSLELENIGDKRGIASRAGVENIISFFNHPIIASERFECDEHEHENDEESDEREPYFGCVGAEGKRLVFVNADAFWGFALETECLPNIATRNILSHRPGNLFAGSFARNHTWRRNVIRHICRLADSDLPGELPKHKTRPGL